MSHDMLTAPLNPGGSFAEWRIHDDDEKSWTLYQVGVQLYHPAYEIVPFVTSCLQQLGKPVAQISSMRLPVPCGLGLMRCSEQDLPLPGSPPVAQRLAGVVTNPQTERPADPLASLMWTFWLQMQTPDEHRKTFSKRSTRPRVGVAWTVWYRRDGTAEAAFRAFDHLGAVIPTFDFDRRPLEELPEALLATTRLAAIFKSS